MPPAAIAALLLSAQDPEELVLVTVVWGGIGAFVGALVVMWLYALRRR